MGTANSNTPNRTPSRGQIPNPSPAGSIVEALPISQPIGAGSVGTIAGGSPDEMFLSPRVLDAGAFTRYSEMLKSIITQANTQGRSLEDFSTDAEAMIKRCEDAGGSINKRMQAGVRMLKMIDERAAKTEALLEKVHTSLPDPQDLGAKIDAIIEERMNTAQIRIDEIVAKSEQRVIEAEERAAEAMMMSDGQAKKLADLTARIETQLTELDARIEHTRENTSASLRDLIEQTNEARDELGASIDAVLGRAQQSGEQLAIKIDEASMLTDARIGELNQSIKPLLEASRKAMETLGMDPDKPVFEDSPLARIEGLVERGEVQSASLDRVYRQLEDLQSQGEGIKAVFGVWLLEAAQQLDVLEDRKSHIIGPMNEAAEKITTLGPDLEDKLEVASTHLTHMQIEQQALRVAIDASSKVASDVSARMTNESGQLQALLDGSLHQLSTRVEQAGVWLGALIQRAENLGGTLPGAGQMNFGTPAPTPAPAPSPVHIVEQPIVVAEIESTEGEKFQSPQPPCLPIDSFSFDGASIVIEHTNDS